MKLKYLTCMAGDRFTRNAGDVAEVDEPEAGRLIRAGFAEPVADPVRLTREQLQAELATWDAEEIGVKTKRK